MATFLQILVEDKTINPELESEHGFSMLVKGEGIKFIFDCGQTGLAWKNAEKLGIDFSDINTAVISHSHYDHGGGFPELIKYAKIKTLYAGETFFEKKFSLEGVKYMYKGIGYTDRDLSKWRVKQQTCSEILQLDDKIFLFGKFNRKYDFETIPNKFYVGRGTKKILDTFDDEICIAIRGKDGLNVVVACSHVGIVNIVSTVAGRLNEPIVRVIGGVHLLHADEERINKTLDELKNLGVKDLKLCHCSGEKVCEKINVEPLFTGSVIKL